MSNELLATSGGNPSCFEEGSFSHRDKNRQAFSCTETLGLAIRFNSSLRPYT